MWFLAFFPLILSGTLSLSIKEKTLSVSLADIVERINTDESSTWKAGHNFPLDTPLSYFKSLTGVLPFDENIPELREFVQQSDDMLEESFGEDDEDDESEDDYIETMGCKNAKGLPRNFDAREHWPHCPSLKHIIDQSSCGSCWAVSVAGAISDRLCIASNGYFNGLVSSEQINACTPKCWGCRGGWPQLAWRYFGHNGVVTGGDYQSQEGCQPYSLPPCNHHVNGDYVDCSKLNLTTPTCARKCNNPHYEASYDFDLKKGKKAHMVPRCNAMRQIYEHGPIVAIYSVFEDFLQYKSGVYQHNFGEQIGLHAVKVLGWGVENDIPYWLVANSWNNKWGDSGTFKILRGENEADIEMGFNAGYPKFIKL